LDVGSSSVKASVVDATTGKTIATAQSPEEEIADHCTEAGWAEQHPDLWMGAHPQMYKACLQKGIKASSLRRLGFRIRCTASFW